MFLQLPGGRPNGLTHQMHVRFDRRPSAFAQVARRAGGGDILPHRSPALGARNNVVESQLPVRSAIDAVKFVAQEEVETREGRIFVRPYIIAKGDDARQLQSDARTVHLAVVMRDNIDSLEEHRLDRRLPRPQRQRIIRQRRVIGVEHQRRAAFGMSDQLRMIHSKPTQSLSFGGSELQLPGLVALKEERAHGPLPLLPTGCQAGVAMPMTAFSMTPGRGSFRPQLKCS